MGTRYSFTIDKKTYKNLYAYWQETLTTSLQAELKKDEVILNLASQEYAKAIDFKSITNQMTQVDFKVMKNGTPKTIGIYAKRQRGEMTNWIIKNRLEDVEDLKKYQNGDFKYSKSLSKVNHLVFLKI